MIERIESPPLLVSPSPSLPLSWSPPHYFNMIEQPTLIKGGTYTDHRGTMRFVNAFDFPDVKRFYFIKHPDTTVVRAWQGHQFEKKYFYPIKGRFLVAWVKIDDFLNPSEDLIPEHHILSADISELISVPKGYANGLKALEPHSELMVFSDMDVEESVREKIRFPAEKWLDWSKFE